MRPRLLVATLACVGLVLASAAPASAAPTTAGGYLIEIQAVPALAGLGFTLGDRTFATDGEGVARVTVSRPGTYRLHAVEHQLSQLGNRVNFTRWVDSVFSPGRKVEVRSPKTRLEAGYSVTYPVRLEFLDLKGRPIDPEQITKVVLANSLGHRETFRGTDADRWLLGSRVARLYEGLSETEIQYAVERVEVDGTNVVNEAQQRFYPAKQNTVYLQLLFFSAHVRAHDAFFGFALGSAIRVVYPSGRVERFELESGAQITLPSLPRGEYQITVEGPGLSFTRPLALSKDQEVSLEVLSYLDVAAVLSFLASLAVGLVLVGRPHLRHALLRRLRLRPVLEQLGGVGSRLARVRVAEHGSAGVAAAPEVDEGSAAPTSVECSWRFVGPSFIPVGGPFSLERIRWSCGAAPAPEITLSERGHPRISSLPRPREAAAESERGRARGGRVVPLRLPFEWLRVSQRRPVGIRRAALRLLRQEGGL